MNLVVEGTRMTYTHVSAIPKLTHSEAGELSQTEYERVLALLETLEGDDWQQPTYCTEWDVRDMVAHLAGAVAGSTSFAEFMRQNVQNPYIKEFDEPVDGTNKMQILERAAKTTDQLIEEFRVKGQIAVNNRSKLPWLVRKIALPMGSMGITSFEYLMDTIYPRDQWMHRYDICAATGNKMIVTPQHDGRIVALVLRDIHKKLKKELQGRSILLRLSGPAGADYLFGDEAEQGCLLEVDLFDFNLRASGRISVDELLSRAVVEGDQAMAHWFLANCEVMY